MPLSAASAAETPSLCRRKLVEGRRVQLSGGRQTDLVLERLEGASRARSHHAVDRPRIEPSIDEVRLGGSHPHVGQALGDELGVAALELLVVLVLREIPAVVPQRERGQ